MRQHLWISAILFVAIGAPIAKAAPIPFTINFTVQYSPSPSVGSFNYDDVTHKFTEFLVQWNGVQFDLTAPANSPGFYPGASTCLSGKTGAEITFALLSQSPGPSCPFDPILNWGANTNTSASQSTFFFLGLGDPTFGPYYRYNVIVNGGPAGFAVTWSGGTVSVLDQSIPEPSTMGMMVFAGVFLARKRIATLLRRSPQSRSASCLPQAGPQSSRRKSVSEWRIRG